MTDLGLMTDLGKTIGGRIKTEGRHHAVLLNTNPNKNIKYPDE